MAGPLDDLDEVLRIAVQTTEALVCAHQRGVIHRDIKPANILLEGAEQRVKVTDFGLARFAADPRLTASGLVAGTPEYMAPEQAADEEVTVRSDLFSLGVVLYVMLTGQSPFRGQNTLSTLRRLCTDIPPSPVEVNPDTPPWLNSLTERLLSKSPGDRPISAEAVLRELRQHTGSTSPPETVPTAAAERTGSDTETRRQRHRSPRARFGWRWPVSPCWWPVWLGGAPWKAEDMPADVGGQAEPAPRTAAGFYVADRAEPFADLGAAIEAGGPWQHHRGGQRRTVFGHGLRFAKQGRNHSSRSRISSRVSRPLARAAQ